MASEIVVGIDFGTTHSGVSWAVKGGNQKVRLITDWPHPGSTLPSVEKVPTAISYENGEPKDWGYNVDFATEMNSFKWFKILLDPEHKLRNKAEPVVAASSLLRSLGKSAEDVAADYLRLIWEYTCDDIKRMKGDDWGSMYNVKVVLTVPAIWSPAAKDRTEKVALAAGLPKDVSLVSEPEAAALAVLHDRDKTEEPIKVGDAFVVCDAGGGTVDLISYRVTGINPLRMEECAIGDGGLCGSVFVDAAFERYVKTVVGEKEYEAIRPRARKRMMKEFENSVKRCYTGDDKEFSVDLPGVQDNPEEGIDDDTIKLKPSVLKTVFDHVINQIVKLVDKQVDEVQEGGHKVRAVLLVGGFGSNRYMYQRLKSASKEVLQVSGAWSAICRGATIWGLENAGASRENSPERRTVVARIARHSYGIKCALPFIEGVHLPKDRCQHQDGTWFANNQMQWLLKKGARIEVGKILEIQMQSTVHVGLFDRGIVKFSDALYFCPKKVAPSRYDDTVQKLCNVQYGIQCSKLWKESSYRDPNTDIKWRDATFDMKLKPDSAMLHFEVHYKGKQVAYTTADYKEELANT